MILRHPLHFIAYGFGSGLVPHAPGTVGTLVAVPLFLVIALLPDVAIIFFLVFVTLLGCWACHVTARALNQHDPKGIVFDEMVGFWWAVLGVPQDWVWLGMSFIFFRLLDIWKPWPIRWIDGNVKGGLGIMLDDLLAAGLTQVIIRILIQYYN